MTFKPGQSGNPGGRAAGSRNKASLAVESLLQGEAKNLTRRAVEVAMTGDVQALKLCIDRLAPQRRGSPVRLDLPPIETAADVFAALGVIAAAVASGQITPEEGQSVAGIMEQTRRSLELLDIERKLAALEVAAGR